MIKYDVICRFFRYVLYQSEENAFYSSFSVSFHYEWILDFV